MKPLTYVPLLFVALSLSTPNGVLAQNKKAATVAPKRSQTPPRRSQTSSNTKKLGAVKVAGVDVSGLTPQEARRRLTRQLSRRLNYVHILTDGRRTIPVRRRYLGVQLNINGMVERAKSGQRSVPLMVQVNRATLQKALRRVSPRFDAPVRNAWVKEINRSGDVRIMSGWPGRRIDVAASAATLAPKLQQNPSTRHLTLKVKPIPVRITAGQLRGINGRLGRYTTRFNAGNVKRTKNLRLGVSRIDGTILKPGDVFSLNKVVGPRTQQRGFRTASIFKNGYKVPGIGAGVSQVTGTLFNAALLSGLDIVTYRTHSRPVPYLTVGRDATVAWGGFDMKFKNNTNAPIYISYQVSGNRAIATLYGRKTPGQRVNLYVSAQRKGPREITAQLYRTIRRNGKVVKKEKVGSSHYKWEEGDWED